MTTTKGPTSHPTTTSVLREAAEQLRQTYPPAPAQEFRTVRVKAQYVGSDPDGTTELRIPVRILSMEEMGFLRALFPHTEAQVIELLDKEALLSAIVRNI